MYFSKLVLNARKTEVLRDLSNSFKLHQRIMQAFPDENNREEPRKDWHILFRQEPDSDVLLVQSNIEPNWTKLPNGYLSHQAVKETTLGVDHFKAGGVFQFRLRANPSKRDAKTKKTIGFYRRTDQISWLERQGERCGFRLHQVDVMPSPNVFGIKIEGAPPIRISTALYQGFLEVTDSNYFLTVVQQGLGRGKSYGCGLLSLIRVS